MIRYQLTPIARDDLRDIIEFIRGDNPTAAKRVLAEFKTAMRRLSRSPDIGHLREDLVDEPLRFWPVYSYLIIYRAEIRPIQIIRVLHGSRDVRSILHGEF